MRDNVNTRDYVKTGRRNVIQWCGQKGETATCCKAPLYRGWLDSSELSVARQ